MTTPAYRDITAEMVKIVARDGVVVRIISGQYQGIFGPMQGDYVKTLYLDVSLQPHTRWTIDLDPLNTVFCYLVAGSGAFDEDSGIIPDHRAVLLGDGQGVSVESGPQGLRFLLISGRPLKESIAWGGPIVMNTREELREAFAQLDNGTFIR
jgi:hypothetical protein